MKKEQVIVSLTTWSKRISNLPLVLDSIYAQSYLPDKVVLNLAYEEVIPEDIAVYLKKHDVEINYVKDTKVYKKIMPTLRKYSEACVINIDDDCIYPTTMVEDFMAMHSKYPNFPVSGNHVVSYGMQCHCGMASLTKAEYFGTWLDVIDDELIQNCPSSDIVYSFLAARNRHPYIYTEREYFMNLVQSSLEQESYSSSAVKENGVAQTYAYLVKRFGKQDSPYADYLGEYMAKLIMGIISDETEEQMQRHRMLSEEKVRSSFSYRLGRRILRPFKAIANIWR